MGGHHAGEYASSAVVDALSELAFSGSIEELESQSVAALNAVNEQLFSGQGRLMGSTVVVLMSLDGQARLIWAGDSRAYRLRQGRLEQLTRDHSRIQVLIDQGKVSPSEAERHPEANIITRAVGVTAQLELDSQQLDVRDGDTYLLCSDGLYRYITEAQMKDALGHGNCDQACDQLVALALSSPARDNITAIVVRAELDDTAIRTRINPAATDGPPGDDDPTVLDESQRR
jgi:serine/threonine protein phosphatase PrpC